MLNDTDGNRSRFDTLLARMLGRASLIGKSVRQLLLRCRGPRNKSGVTKKEVKGCAYPRLFISGWICWPNASTPSIKSSNVSSTPPVLGTSAISSNIRATLA